MGQKLLTVGRPSEDDGAGSLSGGWDRRYDGEEREEREREKERTLVFSRPPILFPNLSYRIRIPIV